MLTGIPAHAALFRTHYQYHGKRDVNVIQCFIGTIGRADYPVTGVVQLSETARNVS